VHRRVEASRAETGRAEASRAVHGRPVPGYFRAADVDLITERVGIVLE